MSLQSFKQAIYTMTCLLMFSVPITPANAEEMILEIIPLKHSLLSDVLPVIQPLIADGGTATGMNDQLIVKTTPSNLIQIKKLLNNLDTAPRRLMIIVKQNVDGNLTHNEHGLSGKYRSGDVTVQSPDVSDDGASVAIQDKEGNILRYRTLITKSNIDDRNTFRVQTIAGQPAFIQQGSSVPVANQQTFITPDGVLVQEGVEYRNVTSGFYVLPRLNGNRVTLLVSPQLNKVSPHQGATFDLQNIETTASGQLGEWIQIGGITEQYKEKNSRNLVSTRSQGQEIRNVLIKVIEIF